MIHKIKNMYPNNSKKIYISLTKNYFNMKYNNTIEFYNISLKFGTFYKLMMYSFL